MVPLKRSTKPLVFGRADPGSPVLDAVEVEVEFVGVLVGAAEFPAVVGEDGADRQVEMAVEGQHLVVEHGDGRLGLLGDMQEAEGIGAVGVDDGMQIDLADALEIADEEGVG